MEDISNLGGPMAKPERRIEISKVEQLKRIADALEELNDRGLYTR